ncbi:MAG TPA: tRNA (N6-threonylcarbamoyladenosine(37)-N6)-methyltransferase TrmO [Thermoflexia bacterium]|nr:tRNA (N6-threonylcarbamoyladenosine(37)-N6)-methyltransferase TrmO [Thermoflexia bacterium]
MQTIIYRPIGIIHTPFQEQVGVPIQPTAGRGLHGYLTLEPEYLPGLKDLAGFSHLLLLYHFHLSEGYSLQAQPYMDETPRGVFAMRAPRRPNPIGLSLVRLERIEGATLHFLDVDMVDGTPLLDIKPYVPFFRSTDEIRLGWLTGKSRAATTTHADDRFLTTE